MTTATPTSDTAITPLCDAVMRGVARANVVTEDNVGHAVAIMREEIKALIAGDKYADERDCVVRGSVHGSYVIASVIAECVRRILDHGHPAGPADGPSRLPGPTEASARPSVPVPASRGLLPGTGARRR